MEGSRKNGKNDRYSCLTMHQPWASLLVHGIKRIEGRSWPAPIRGRIWIHAAGKVPDAATIKAMEDFYREIYAVNGITDLEFPQQYPVSRLIGCVEVVGCLRREELAHWNEVAEGVRLEALTDYCWLCEQPKKLRVPIEMRGFHGVYELDRKICEAATGDLIPVDSSLLVKFQLPNPQDPFSLKPGSISACFPKSKASEILKSPSLSAAIAAASAAATQYSKKGQNLENNAFNSRSTKNSTRQWQLKSNSSAEDKMVSNEVGTLSRHRDEGNSSSYSKPFLHAESSHHPRPHSKDIDAFDSRNTKIFTRQWQLKSNSSAEHKMVSDELGAQPCHHNEGNRSSYPKQVLHAESSHRPGPHSKIFAAAVRGLRPG